MTDTATPTNLTYWYSEGRFRWRGIVEYGLHSATDPAVSALYFCTARTEFGVRRQLRRELNGKSTATIRHYREGQP